MLIYRQSLLRYLQNVYKTFCLTLDIKAGDSPLFILKRHTENNLLKTVILCYNFYIMVY